MKITNKTQLNRLKLKSVKVLVIFALFLIPSAFAPTTAFALTEQEQLNQLNKKINEANNALKETQAEKRSLQNEIGYYDSEISKSQSKISSLNSQISNLGGEIGKTEIEIIKAETELKKNQDYLSEALRLFYEEGQTSTIELIASSSNFSDFVNKSEYLQVMQLRIKDSADNVIQLMNNLNAKKQALAQKKKSSEELKNEEQVEKNQLLGQKSVKDYLLAETKGNEAEYQALIKKLKAQEAALQAAIWSKNNGSYVSLGKVKAGDIIGYVGNTGYSTGCHLHFEIRNPQQGHVNPNSYIGNGYYINPVPGVRQNVPYGYSSAYFPGVFHTGVDYADGCKGTPIRATAPGDIIKRVSGRPNTYPWSLEYGNYVMIRHTNGWYSLYGHLR